MARHSTGGRRVRDSAWTRFVVTLFAGVTAAARRFEDMPLAQPPAVNPTGAVGRARVVRRRSGIAYAGMLVSVSFFLPALVYRHTEPPAGNRWLVVAGALLIYACALLGPVARFVVTPRHLHVDTALRRTSVPRHLLAGFSRHGQLVRVALTDGTHLDVRVDSPLWDRQPGVSGRTNDRCQIRTTARIAALLSQVPAAPYAATDVTLSVRPVTIGVGVLAALAVVGLLLTQL